MLGPSVRGVDITSALLAAASGLGAGLSLIVAIGSQNAFVLRQGLRAEHVAAVVAVCLASDVVLISAGVAGAGAVVERSPALLGMIRVAGAAFLLGYAVLAARRAMRPGALVASVSGPRVGLGRTVAACLALTWLNPHVYVDTVVLLGSLAQTYDGDEWWFAAGAVAGSTVWFAALGFGARLLRPAFARPAAWRILDASIAVVMVAIAAALLLPLLP